MTINYFTRRDALLLAGTAAIPAGSLGLITPAFAEPITRAYGCTVKYDRSA